MFFSPLRLAGDMGDLARGNKLIKLLSRICLERIIKYLIAHFLLQRTSTSAKDGVSSNTAQKQGPHTLWTAGHVTALLTEHKGLKQHRELREHHSWSWETAVLQAASQQRYGHHRFRPA